jgi:phospholipid/cholesterol/gamma-HCH transport system permease protein
MATTASTPTPSLPFWLSPIGWLGKSVIGVLAYLGGMALLTSSAAISVFSFERDEDTPGFWPVANSELAWILFTGFPLVGLVHVGMGSFLSMQAYFGSTFVDGTGAVVGVGLLRNLATLMTGMTLSGLLAGRIIPDLLGRQQSAAEEHARSRDTGNRAQVASMTEQERMTIGSLARIAAPRMFAAAVGCTLLSLWGALVGTIVGWQTSGTILGLSSETFFLMLYQMIWFRDVMGMIVKGTLFGFFIATVCCFEGLRGWRRPSRRADGESEHLFGAGPTSTSSAIVRAACLSIVAILVGNMTWFILVYHAVPVYGPSLLAPPGP